MALNSEIQAKTITLQKEIKTLDSIAQEYNSRSSSSHSSRYSQFPRASDISSVRPTLGPASCDQCLMSHERSPPFYRDLESSGQCLMIIRQMYPIGYRMTMPSEIFTDNYMS